MWLPPITLAVVPNLSGELGGLRLKRLGLPVAHKNAHFRSIPERQAQGREARRFVLGDFDQWLQEGLAKRLDLVDAAEEQAAVRPNGAFRAQD